MIESGRPAEALARFNDSLPEDFWADGDPVVEEQDPAADAKTSLVSLGFITAAIKRKKRVWCITAVIGLLVGCGLFVTTKPSYSVTVTILMTNDQSVDQPTAMQTDALLAQDPAFAQSVMTALGINEPVTTFVQSYSVTDLSDELLSISANAPTAAGATNLADTLGNSYLSFRAGLLEKQLQQTISGFNTKVTQAQQSLAAIQAQISQVQAGGSSTEEQATLKKLQARETAASDLLISMQQTAGSNQANLTLTVTHMINGSRILSSSYPTRVHSPKKLILEYVLGGLFGGLVLGFAIVAIGAVVSERLRRRDDVAAALGVPVRLSVQSCPPGKRSSRPSKQRDADVRRVVTYFRDAVPRGSARPRTLAVVAVDNEAFVASMVADLARALTRDGTRVLAADLTGGALARQLGQSAQGIHTIEVDRARMVLAVPDPEDLAPSGPLNRQASEKLLAASSAADVLVVVATVHPAVNADYLGSWANDAVIVVTAGSSTAVRLHGVGEMIRGAGMQGMSAVLLGADKNDQTLGAVSDRG
jgi:capsular polysaccharide biosynthesis protein